MFLLTKTPGKIYQSVSEASRKTNESETRIRNKLNRNQTGYEIIQKVECSYKRICAGGEFFDSITEAVKNGKAKNRLQAYRKLKNPNQTDWYYLN